MTEMYVGAKTMEMTELMTDPLAKMEQTETMMMTTEQTEKIGKTALMGQTEKMEATETMEKTAQMPADACQRRW